MTAPKSDDEVITLAAMSMVGQPPSDSSTDVTGNSTSVETNNILVHGTGNDLKNIIKHIYGHADLGNYQDVIIHERLDEKESMYMNGALRKKLVRILTYGSCPRSSYSAASKLVYTSARP